MNQGDLLIGVVGPCGSGKTTLVTNLRLLGFRGKGIAQEHSYVQDMWLRLTKPAILLYLQASYPIATARKHFTWSEKDYEVQLYRLMHARDHSDKVIETDDLTPDEVCREAVLTITSWIQNRQSN